MSIKKLQQKSLAGQSFAVRNDHFPQYHNTWHYHDELEFIYIREGSGTLCIGDCILTFHPGTCVLIGENIPHYWRFDPEYLEHHNADVFVVHFLRQFAGSTFFELPEMSAVRHVLDRSSRGLWTDGLETTPFSLAFCTLLQAPALERFTIFLQLLNSFASNLGLTELISDQYRFHRLKDYPGRMNTVFRFIHANFQSGIDLMTLANLSGMTRNSFCRYFKQQTGKTLMEFTTELRVSHACKLLRDARLSVKECCYDAGFTNFVSFHKAFKRITGNTPHAYKVNEEKAV